MQRSDLNLFDVDLAAVGRRVHALRKRAGLTQGMLADMIGVSTSFIGHIERGEKKASVETMARLSGAFDTSLDYLVFGVGNRCACDDCPLRDDLAAFLREHRL